MVTSEARREKRRKLDMSFISISQCRKQKTAAPHRHHLHTHEAANKPPIQDPGDNLIPPLIMLRLSLSRHLIRSMLGRRRSLKAEERRTFDVAAHVETVWELVRDGYAGECARNPFFARQARRAAAADPAAAAAKTNCRRHGDEQQQVEARHYMLDRLQRITWAIKEVDGFVEGLAVDKYGYLSHCRALSTQAALRSRRTREIGSRAPANRLDADIWADGVRVAVLRGEREWPEQWCFEQYKRRKYET
ncbi:hypothetical protein B0T24DRAFT_82699 [Lasiosphaeria ovina]|uniref:Uncharacterized protein n=1 Tax=Lasiosphaeria ovina TaxID=92902 RepID=A0AAE0NMX3_9PEZI|nr:hypothetical protein B0T24DRAFT_82699 [Lasiosphaeria ovina]